MDHSDWSTHLPNYDSWLESTLVLVSVRLMAIPFRRPTFILGPSSSQSECVFTRFMQGDPLRVPRRLRRSRRVGRVLFRATCNICLFNQYRCSSATVLVLFAQSPQLEVDD